MCVGENWTPEERCVKKMTEYKYTNFIMFRIVFRVGIIRNKWMVMRRIMRGRKWLRLVYGENAKW